VEGGKRAVPDYLDTLRARIKTGRVAPLLQLVGEGFLMRLTFQKKKKKPESRRKKEGRGVPGKANYSDE